MDSSKDDLFKYAVLSKLSYNDHVSLGVTAREVGVSSLEEQVFPFKFLQKNGSHCWMFIHGDELVLAFRGSASIDDILQSIILHYTQFEKGKGKVHVGFLYHYMILREDILSELYLLKTRFGIRRVTMTGHSMGGSCAMICASDIKHNPEFADWVVSCVTFGSPATGDKKFCDDLRDKCTHVVVENDVVPFLFRSKHQTDPVKIRDDQVMCIFNHNIIKYTNGLKNRRGSPPVANYCTCKSVVNTVARSAKIIAATHNTMPQKILS